MDRCTLTTEDGRNYVLTRGGRALTVGRGNGVTIRLWGVPGVSRLHARFSWPEQRRLPLVEDLGSTNGTRVNGREIHLAQVLNDAAQVGVGEAVLTVQLTGEREPALIQAASNPVPEAPSRAEEQAVSATERCSMGPTALVSAQPGLRCTDPGGAPASSSAPRTAPASTP